MNLRLLNSILLIFLLCSSSYGAVIFEDNFDNRSDWTSDPSYNISSHWPATMQTILGGPTTVNSPPAWYSWRQGDKSNTKGAPLYVVDQVSAHGGIGKSLKYNLENSAYINGGGIDLVLCNTGTCGYDTITVRMYLKFDSNFEFEPSNFLKIIRMYTGVDVQNDTMEPSSTYAKTEDYPDIKRSMNCYFDVVSDGNNELKSKFIFFRGIYSGEDYIENELTDTASDRFDWRAERGSWIFVQIQAKLNTIGNSDGFLKIWSISEQNINTYNEDTPQFSWEGIEIRTDENRHFNTLIFLDNMYGQYAGDNEETVVLDDLIVTDGELPGPVAESPTCDSSHLDPCTDPTSCQNAGGNWCDGVCQSEPCATAFNCGAVPIMQVH